MRRRPVSIILASIILVMMLASCSGGGHNTSSSSSTTKAKTPTTTVVAPDISTVPSAPHEIKTQKVSPWGTIIYNDKGNLSLQGVSHDFGDNASISTFELCAVGEDVPLSDVGYGNSPVGISNLPEEGKVLSTHEEVTLPKHFINIDDSKTTLVADNGGDYLERLLLEGHCTKLTIEMLTGSDRLVAAGFSHVTDPFGEWRSDGGFTYLDTQRADPDSFSYEVYVN